MTKEELITLAKELSEVENLKERRADVLTLKRESKKFDTRDSDSYFETKAAEEFNKYFAVVMEKDSLLHADVTADKKEIIEKAKVLVNAKNFKKATEEMKELFNNYKACGRGSKEEDDACWAEFKKVQDEFYAKKKEFFEDQANKVAAAKEAKEAIVARAEEALKIENFKAANAEFNKLMDEWKNAGYAGKFDQELWGKFSAVRHTFFDKRKEFTAKLDEEYAKKVAAKEELIKKAKVLLANSSFTKEEIKAVKDLRNAWKEVGFAGKNKENELWAEFNGVLDKYFEALRAF